MISSLARAMRTASPGRIAFALVMIALGIVGFVTRDFAPIWQPVPKGVPAREILVYLTAVISLACGIGLCWERIAQVTSIVLLASLAGWLLLFRVTQIVVAPASQEAWSGFGETAVIVAGAWVLSARFATHRGLRFARALYGVSLIIFGIAHLRYLEPTASLVPAWLPWHSFWAYFTAGTFIAAGIGIMVGLVAKWAAALSALQMALFTLLVWVPVVMSGANAFQWSELLISIALTAGGWVVAESYGPLPQSLQAIRRAA